MTDQLTRYPCDIHEMGGINHQMKLLESYLLPKSQAQQDIVDRIDVTGQTNKRPLPF